MCRHTAWLGRPRTLQELLVDPAHGLLRQSWEPRAQRYGTVNADGFGVGWFSDERAEPARYRRAVPMWGDPSFASLAGVVRSTCVLAAVRSATAGTPHDETACAPFLLGDVLLSLNGRVDVDAIAHLVPSAPLAALGSTVDSAYVAALVGLRLAAGEPLAAAVAATVRTVGELDPAARLNLLATDGRTAAATAWGDTLVLRADERGVLLASEPGDDEPGWRTVPDRTLVCAAPDDVALEDL